MPCAADSARFFSSAGTSNSWQAPKRAILTRSCCSSEKPVMVALRLLRRASSSCFFFSSSCFFFFCSSSSNLTSFLVTSASNCFCSSSFRFFSISSSFFCAFSSSILLYTSPAITSPLSSSTQSSGFWWRPSFRTFSMTSCSISRLSSFMAFFMAFTSGICTFSFRTLSTRESTAWPAPSSSRSFARFRAPSISTGSKLLETPCNCRRTVTSCSIRPCTFFTVFSFTYSMGTFSAFPSNSCTFLSRASTSSTVLHVARAVCLLPGAV
mmetsp:Transcript_143214/g.399230  ORF Transcript_143214/g.399230 Transcript_143214/m.399230 type:complete len:267 (-) Transcript_143214:2342-3142(-)